jgi:hypothetical protein
VAIVPNGIKADEMNARPGRARSKTAPSAQIGDRHGQPQRGMECGVCKPSAGNKRHGLVQWIGGAVMHHRPGNLEPLQVRQPKTGEREQDCKTIAA